MEVILAKDYGMCTGVRIALRKAERVAATNEKAYTLGRLVHNSHVINYFEDKRIYVAESIKEIKKGTVIIRAHGVPDSIKKEARKKKLKVVDATCGHVLKVKNLALKLKKEGYHVVMYGEHGHAEVKGVVGNLNKKDYTVISDASEINKIPECNKIGLVSQTTMTPEGYENVQQALQYMGESLKVKETICLATQDRQASARYVAKLMKEEKGAMVVIGEKGSKNSENLRDICLALNEKTSFIGSKADLNKDYFNKISKVGVTASASSPDWIIDDVVEALRGM